MEDGCSSEDDEHSWSKSQFSKEGLVNTLQYKFETRHVRQVFSYPGGPEDGNPQTDEHRAALVEHLKLIIELKQTWTHDATM